MKDWLNTTELKGTKVKHELLNAASDGELWKLWFTSVPSENTIDSYITDALSDKEKGNSFPFVVIDNRTNKVIGATRYCNADFQNKRLEIGYTWYSKKYQRTGVNTECKYLLLIYAFEELKCIAVEFRTNWHNFKSRSAISRLGAKQDGVLRNHRLNHDGSYRDTVVFSITKEEWGSVEKSLRFEMEKHT